ncbi:MAG: B12-binding domain-containing radical SAM protein [Clostridia bacterium]|nr:B12-binding domain-containing radical SAM protein [Clostridia bacterium]
MQYEGSVYRPPSEAGSLIIQATIGCSHNGCTFCPMYWDKKFKMRSFEEIYRDLQEARRENPRVDRIFLADGDALCVATDKLLPILGALSAIFPECSRVGIYGRAENILRKTDKELRELRQAGLGIIYLGAESGSAEVLKRVNKGETPEDMITAVHRAENAGIHVSVTFISGLGGRELLEEHAVQTGKMIGEMGASFVGLMTLMIAPGSSLSADIQSGKFEPLNMQEVMKELELILQNANCEKNCVIRSNHASNRLVLKGTLPTDKQRLLNQVQSAMKDEKMLRPDKFRGF